MCDTLSEGWEDCAGGLEFSSGGRGREEVACLAESYGRGRGEEGKRGGRGRILLGFLVVRLSFVVLPVSMDMFWLRDGHVVCPLFHARCFLTTLIV